MEDVSKILEVNKQNMLQYSFLLWNLNFHDLHYVRLLLQIQNNFFYIVFDD